MDKTPQVQNEDTTRQEEVGLPKSTLWNFIKEELNQNKVKADRNIYQLIDKICIRYVNYVSSLGSQICTTKGKKTLNVEHILDALKAMNFNNHIKALTKELLELEKNGMTEEGKYEDHTNVKQLINKNKKKTGKRKRQFETEEEKEEMAREQMMLFEMARQEQMNSLMNHQKENNTNMVPNNNNSMINKTRTKTKSTSKRQLIAQLMNEKAQEDANNFGFAFSIQKVNFNNDNDIQKFESNLKPKSNYIEKQRIKGIPYRQVQHKVKKVETIVARNKEPNTNVIGNTFQVKKMPIMNSRQRLLINLRQYSKCLLMRNHYRRKVGLIN